MVDQVVSSGSNFALGVLIARAGGPGMLGVFGVVFVIWVVLVGLNRALVCEPMTVTGAASGDAQRGEGANATLALAIAAAAVLAAVAAVLLGVGVAGAVDVLALAPFLPALLLQDYCRFLAFRLARPDHALISDLAFLAAQAAVTAALLLCHESSLSAYLTSWGVGGCVGALAGILLCGLRPGLRGGISHLRALWPTSRWFLVEFSMTYAASQGYLCLLPILLDAAAFGLYRAAMGLVGPLVVLFVAGGNVGLPGCVRSLRESGLPGLNRYAIRLTAGVLALTLPYCVAVAFLARPLLTHVYGARFDDSDAIVLTRIVAVVYVVAALGFGFGVALKAVNQMQRLWSTRLISIAISALATILLTRQFGLIGAGLASVVAAGSYTVGVAWNYWAISVSRNSRSAGNLRVVGRPRTPRTIEATPGSTQEGRMS